MEIEILKSIIQECCNDVVFEYAGKKSGVTVTVHNYVPTWQVWHGEETKEYDLLEHVMTDKFYSNASLEDIAEETDFWFV